MIAAARTIGIAVAVAACAVGAAYGQLPGGTISGVVTDPSGARVAAAGVSVASVRSGQTWTLAASSEGTYSITALLPGEYRVTVSAAGFNSTERHATVEAGTTTTVDVALDMSGVASSITVRALVPLLHRDEHQIGGVVKREQIENVPLNGRSFLELAKLEPGVTSPVRGAAGNRTFVATLGSGLQAIPRIGFTRVTVDGASINATGTIGTSLQISPEAVQEFQLTTAGFDVATSLTTNGAVNIVTRSGTNDFRGSGFTFYRDHHLAAYPGLSRDPRNPEPFFRRRQLGTAGGGPLRRNRAFFFAGYEWNHQDGVAAVQSRVADLDSLGGIFPTSAAGNLVTGRADGQLSSRHSLTLRYTRDASSSFAAPVAGVLPSGWTNQINEADQSLVSVSSLWPHGIVNETRVSYFRLDSVPKAADASLCRGCFGLDGPRVTVLGAGLSFGTPPNLQTVAGARYQLTESFSWPRGRHRLRFGFDWEHSRVRTVAPDADRLLITVWSPQSVAQANATAGVERIRVPASFVTVEDVLQLPLRSFELTVGPGASLERDFRPHRTFDLYRLYAADTWRVTSSITVNAGLGWSYEPNALNHDLTKPPLLAPLLGDRGLDPPDARLGNVSPTIGVAWGANAKTIVRGGIGRYFDPASSANLTNLANERFLLSPLGTGRLTIGSNVRWNGILLDFPQPSTFTAADLLRILPAIRAEPAGVISPANRDYAVRNINRSKEGANLADPSITLPSALHLTVGVQRELGSQFVVNADLVWKRFSHVFINGIDYNRYHSESGRVIRRCEDSERNDVHAQCSNGPIMFDTTSGRARYAGLLVRAEKRVPGRAQFLASYALGSYVGNNGTGTGTAETSGGRATGFRNDDWSANYGPLPTDLRHILNVSGYVDLVWQVQVAFNISATSRPPLTAWLENVDLDGDGTSDDLLPGAGVNAFGRELDDEDLRRLVDSYNQQIAGRTLCCGQAPAARVTLPDTYAFYDSFFTQDLRVTRTFSSGRHGMRVLVFGEVFNLFNTANLVQYNGDLLNRATFGQPGARFTQIFGSGGPRAFQLGARVSF